jgi:hypothetical protein
MNTQAFGAFGSSSTQAGGLGLGLSFQDFPASQQDNYLEFADFSQVLDNSSQPCASDLHSWGVVVAVAPARIEHAAVLWHAQGDGYSGLDELSLGVQQVGGQAKQDHMAAVLAGRGGRSAACAHTSSLTLCVLWPAAACVLQLKFDENFDDILDEGASSTHTPKQLPEWACS